MLTFYFVLFSSTTWSYRADVQISSNRLHRDRPQTIAGWSMQSPGGAHWQLVYQVQSTSR